MSVWKVAPVANEPQTQLHQWRVMALPDGSHHLVGYAFPAREGRTSSEIQQFDIDQLRAVTGSGRVYELVGPPGHDGDAMYVWTVWRRLNEVSDFDDVSEQVWATHLAANANRVQCKGAQP
jgi:hypothetical protein